MTNNALFCKVADSCYVHTYVGTVSLRSTPSVSPPASLASSLYSVLPPTSENITGACPGTEKYSLPVLFCITAFAPLCICTFCKTKDNIRVVWVGGVITIEYKDLNYFINLPLHLHQILPLPRKALANVLKALVREVHRNSPNVRHCNKI